MSTLQFFQTICPGEAFDRPLIRIDLDPAHRLCETLCDGVWESHVSLFRIVVLGDLEYREIDRAAATAVLTDQGLDPDLLDAPAAPPDPSATGVGTAHFYDVDGAEVDVSDKRAHRAVFAIRDGDGVERTTEIVRSA